MKNRDYENGSKWADIRWISAKELFKVVNSCGERHEFLTETEAEEYAKNFIKGEKDVTN